MNLIGSTQSITVDVFLKLVETLRQQRIPVGKVGAWVSLARNFRNSKAVADLGQSVTFVKEWEVVAAARHRKPDFERLRQREKSFSPGALWSSVIADRRLIFGRWSKYTQDYRVHFTDDQFGAILEVALEEIDRLFERVQPDAIIGITPVTFGEYLLAECARVRNVPFLTLHSSRVRNYFAYYDTLAGASTHFEKLLQRNVFSEPVRKIARDFLAEGQKRAVIYEGVDLSIRQGRRFRPLKALSALPRSIGGEFRKQSDPELRNDHHDPGAFMPWFFEHVHQPMRAASVARLLRGSGRLVPVSTLVNGPPFAFYPMHSEPEVALQILGRPFHKDQIELLRNLGASLPAGYLLLVKEHPRSFGLRPQSYYQRLMEIPNLRFVGVEADPWEVSMRAALVAVISGTIGLEAAIAGKPVLIFGQPKYGSLPPSMARRCENLNELPAAVQRLLTDYRYDEEGILSVISALVAGSVDIDVYSVLLKKQNRYSPGREGLSFEEKRAQDYDKLARYTLQRIAEEKAAIAEHKAA